MVENINTTCLLLFPVILKFKVANYLAFRVRRAATWPLSGKKKKKLTIRPPSTSFWVFQSSPLLTNAAILFRQTNSLVGN